MAPEKHGFYELVQHLKCFCTSCKAPWKHSNTMPQNKKNYVLPEIRRPSHNPLHVSGVWFDIDWRIVVGIPEGRMQSEDGSL